MLEVSIHTTVETKSRTDARVWCIVSFPFCEGFALMQLSFLSALDTVCPGTVVFALFAMLSYALEKHRLLPVSW
jgi:hypothetical protein